MRYVLAGILCGGIVAVASNAMAAPTPVAVVTSRAALGKAQLVDWGQLGAAGASLSQPLTATTNAGLSFTVLKNNSDTPYLRADQGDGFVGDFLPGEKLLYSTSQTAFDFQFSTPVQAIGGQLQINRPGLWTPYVRVFTIDGGDFAFELPPDTNDQAGDGSAPFVGVAAPGAVISRVLFDSFFGGNTGINQLSIVVPEPTAGLTVAGIVAGMVTGRRRRTASVGHDVTTERG